jgi:hypothetical protein
LRAVRIAKPDTISSIQSAENYFRSSVLGGLILVVVGPLSYESGPNWPNQSQGRRERMAFRTTMLCAAKIISASAPNSGKPLLCLLRSAAAGALLLFFILSLVRQ